MLFSVVIVTYNAGEKVKGTIDSILAQSETDYEIIVKDGLSKDDTLQHVPENEKIKVFATKDAGIYDAMNQAVAYCSGDYILFINAGDELHDPGVLAAVRKNLKPEKVLLYYGDYMCDGHLMQQASVLTGFELYRKPLCHQSIVYSKDVFAEHGLYNLKFRVCADHDLTMRIWSKTQSTAHIPVVVANYEGRGFSESSTGFAMALKEKREINKTYFSKGKYCAYSVIYALTLPKLRAGVVSGKAPGFLKDAYRSLKRVFSR